MSDRRFSISTKHLINDDGHMVARADPHGDLWCLFRLWECGRNLDGRAGLIRFDNRSFVSYPPRAQVCDRRDNRSPVMNVSAGADENGQRVEVDDAKNFDQWNRGGRYD